MNKTIEFVEKEIENSKEFLDRAIHYNLTICIKNETKKLETLQQIKCVLEAWRVVKDKSVDIHDIIHCSSLEVFNCGLYKDYQLTEEEYQKIKKALGVENENIYC